LLSHLAIAEYEHVLEFDGDVLRVSDTVSGSLTLLADEVLQHRYLKATYASGNLVMRLGRPRLRLRIAHDKCLIREFTVPIANRVQARRIAKLQGRTSLPFESGEVVCDYAITDLKNGFMKLTTVIVKRATLERQIDILARANCNPDIVDAVDANGNAYGVNLLESRAGRGIAAAAIPALLICALLLALFALQVEWNKRGDALADLDVEIVNVKAKIDSLLKRSSEINAVADAVTSLRRKRVVELRAVELWNELARAVPDTAWINQLQATKSKISISGFAAEAAPIVSILEQEPLFQEVAFTSPVSFDPGVGAERFAIGLVLVPAGSAEPLREHGASN
jgi:general secretion pathway protein L